MKTIRRWAFGLAPAWLAAWLVVSLNLFSLCCVESLAAHAGTGVPATVGHVHVHVHGHEMPTPGSCERALHNQDTPLAHALPTLAEVDVVPAPHRNVLPVPAYRRLPERLFVVHGPPVNHHDLYLQTQRLRI